MKKRRVEKAIKSLEEKKEEHTEKIRNLNDGEDFLRDYWEKEVKTFEKNINKLKKKLDVDEDAR